MNTSVGSILRSVTPAAMKQLAAACRESSKPREVASHVIEQILGRHLVVETLTVLKNLDAAGWSSEQAAFLIEEVARTAETPNRLDTQYELVLSGPDIDGVHVRDTFAVVNELFVRARHEVVLVGYAVHNGQILFQHLAERLQESPDLHVRMYLDIPRRHGDTSLPDQIVRRYVGDFFTRHWPWERRPALYYDIRSLSDSPENRSSLHAKCVIVDRSTALITSANFTSAAQERNIEAGILIEQGSCVTKLLTYLEGLYASGVIRQAPGDLRSPPPS